MRMHRSPLHVYLVIKMAVIAGSASAESRSETGTSDSDGLVSKSRGMNRRFGYILGLRQGKQQA